MRFDTWIKKTLDSGWSFDNISDTLAGEVLMRLHGVHSYQDESMFGAIKKDIEDIIKKNHWDRDKIIKNIRTYMVKHSTGYELYPIFRNMNDAKSKKTKIIEGLLPDTDMFSYPPIPKVISDKFKKSVMER